jgi:23S rRNA U2552 (ribose-2'-O)-methylase RlmE/FtsJ
MTTTARGFHRFLPTLTEVVQAPAQPAEPPEDLAAKEIARREAFAQRVRQQLREALDGRMQDAVADAMLEQVDVIGERLRRQMDDMVREALDTITERLRAEVDVMVREAVEVVLSDDDPQTVLDPDARPPEEPSP